MPKQKSAKRARNELSLDKKFHIVEEYESTNGSLGIRTLAEKYMCGKTQISNIIKNKVSVREQYEKGLPQGKKRNRTSQFSDLNDAVWEWYKNKNDQLIPVDGPMIQEFASQVAEKLRYIDFKASSGWLTRFKERHNLSQHKVCRESADVAVDTVKSWKERLGSIISGYEMQDIWNLDETGLIYRALPDKSLFAKSKKCKGGKKSKERLTVALMTSATGEKKKPIVIGKYANPRCLKNVHREDLPSGCHPYDLKRRYLNVKLVFFPVNCTSELQPLDLGIIQNFKVHYRKLLLRFIITMTSSERNASEISKSLNVLQAMNWVGEAWHNVKVTTISKCFNSGGISSNTLIEDEEADLFSDFDAIDEDLKNLIKEVSPETTITPYTYLLSDTELPICYCMDNEKELLDSLVINGQAEVRGLATKASEFACLSSKVAAHALKKQSHQTTLEEYFLQQ
eukprot:gene4474-5069_t